MENYRIQKCRICGRLFKTYSMEVRFGDPSCCGRCNKEVEDEIDYQNRKINKYIGENKNPIKWLGTGHGMGCR